MTHAPVLRRAASIAVILSLSLLGACTDSTTPNEAMRTSAEAYIREHVSELSPRSPVLGGTWYVTDVEWQADGSAVVTYEDGHISLSALTSIVERDGAVAAERFTNIMVDGVTAEKPLSKEGQPCGGVDNVQCEPDLFCAFDGAYPDAEGICTK